MPTILLITTAKDKTKTVMHELNGLYVTQCVAMATATDADAMKWWTLRTIYWRCSILSLHDKNVNVWFCCGNLHFDCHQRAHIVIKSQFPDSLCFYAQRFYASTRVSFISMKYCVTASALLLWNIAFLLAFGVFIAQNSVIHSLPPHQKKKNIPTRYRIDLFLNSVNN